MSASGDRNLIARKTSVEIITPKEGLPYVAVKTELSDADEACKLIDILRALVENVWGKTVTFGDE